MGLKLSVGRLVLISFRVIKQKLEKYFMERGH